MQVINHSAPTSHDENKLKVTIIIIHLLIHFACINQHFMTNIDLPIDQHHTINNSQANDISHQLLV